MSYILDALRRAERERELGKTPGIGGVMTTPPTTEGGINRRLLGLLTIGLVIAMAATWLLGHRPRTNVPAAPAAAKPPLTPATPPAPAATPAARPIARPVAEETASAPTAQSGQPGPADDHEVPPVFDGNPELASLDDITPPFASASRTAAESVTQADATNSRATKAEADKIKEQGTAAAPGSGAGAEAAAPGPSDARPMTVEAPSPTPAPPDEQVSEEAAVDHPPLLRDMPPAYRTTFPQLALQVHVYDPDPAKRWVMIDNARYGEGSDVPGGVRIDQIRADGLVLTHAGQQIFWPLVR